MEQRSQTVVCGIDVTVQNGRPGTGPGEGAGLPPADDARVVRHDERILAGQRHRRDRRSRGGCGTDRGRDRSEITRQGVRVTRMLRQGNALWPGRSHDQGDTEGWKVGLGVADGCCVLPATDLGVPRGDRQVVSGNLVP